jgi:surfeit locus 1 family protein
MDRTRARLALLGLLAAAFAGFVALGLWQVERRAWKQALIAQVEVRLAAAPGPAPGPQEWTALDRTDDYRRVVVHGVWLHDRETCTQAVTVRGPGCWVLTPLVTDAGWTVLVNRGYVDAAHRDPAARADGQVAGRVRVAGLLRASEPGGGFLRANDPGIGRWTSRDVALITTARELDPGTTAPYFIDADAASSPAGWPVAGLTVVRFRDHHLIYALTWFGLALMTALAFGVLLRSRRA